MPETVHSYIDGEVDGVVMRPLKVCERPARLVGGIIPSG